MRRVQCVLPVLMLVSSVALAASPALQVSHTVVAPGGEIQVTFTAPVGLPDDAWLGIIPSDVPHGSEAVNEEHDLSYE